MKYFSLVIAIPLFVIDQMIKFLVRKNMYLNESISVISKFFHITYVENDGAAWNILSNNRLLLILIAVMVLIGVYELILKRQNLHMIEKISYGLFIGGVLGNLFDRIVLGHVIDYLDFTIFKYNYPVFNFADICIVTGVIILMIDTLWGEKLWRKSK